MAYFYIAGQIPFYDKHKPVLLIHSNAADENTDFTDSGPTGHTITAGNDAQHDIAQKKFEGSSILFDGTGDYLSLSDHANWDVGTNFTIDFQVKHGDHEGNEAYIAQYENTENFWSFHHVHGTGITFIIYSNDGIIVTTGAGTEITDTNWHHLALCKVGDEYGIYKDGTQLVHVSDSSTDTFTGSLYIGSRSSASLPFYGHMDEIRIVQGNPFGAAPVVGVTDTIIVPTKPYISWR